MIGRGSFGKVLLARHRPSACLYAMKVLKKAMVVKYDQVCSGGAMGLPSFQGGVPHALHGGGHAGRQVEHTKAEREVLEKMSHPFLVKLHYAFQTDTKLYLVRAFGVCQHWGAVAPTSMLRVYAWQTGDGLHARRRALLPPPSRGQVPRGSHEVVTPRTAAHKGLGLADAASLPFRPTPGST